MGRLHRRRRPRRLLPAERASAWHGGGNQKRADATIAAFDAFAKESGVNFTYEYNSYDAYWETLATQSVGNNLPGIVQQVTDQYAGIYHQRPAAGSDPLCGEWSTGFERLRRGVHIGWKL